MKEQLAAWVISMGFSTGHADTVEELLEELEWQIKELRDGKTTQENQDEQEQARQEVVEREDGEAE